MQRSIKFRAWDVTGSEMFSVLMLSWPVGRKMIASGAGGSTDDFILMQFTGLHDKNGREVYEGDIVACSSMKGENCLHQVIWEEPKIVAHMGSWNLSDMNAGYDWIGTEEVRGNLYENPELLNEPPRE